MRNGTPRIASFGRVLTMLEAVIADGGQSGVAAIARDLGVPVATAHRQVASLVAQGCLARLARGRHVAGPRLLRMQHQLDRMDVIAQLASPVLQALASRLGHVVQLGTLENDMVTYRVKAGPGARDLFTKVGMQMEAYCSGVGKVLLANLPEAEHKAYLAGGPFVALTRRTITDPAVLAAELEDVRRRGLAFDKGEVADDLACVALPLRDPAGRVLAAVSVSISPWDGETASLEAALPALEQVVGAIEQAAFGA